MKDYQPLRFDFPDEDITSMNDQKVICNDEGPGPGERWILMFDGPSNAMGHGIGETLMCPKGNQLPFTTKLCFDCTKNIVECEACIMGIEATIDFRIKILEVYKDSSLVIPQIRCD